MYVTSATSTCARARVLTDFHISVTNGRFLLKFGVLLETHNYAFAQVIGGEFCICTARVIALCKHMHFFLLDHRPKGVLLLSN